MLAEMAEMAEMAGMGAPQEFAMCNKKPLR
jgi:hypothetical protein